MIRKLGPLWLSLDKLVAVRRSERGDVTIMMDEGRNIILEREDGAEFLRDLEHAAIMQSLGVAR